MYHSSCTKLTNISNHLFWIFFNSFDTIITCCEGVLWNGDKEIKGSSLTLNRLRECGKQIFFFTNNSMRTREEVVAHAKHLGIMIHEVNMRKFIYNNYIMCIIHLHFRMKLFLVHFLLPYTSETEILIRQLMLQDHEDLVMNWKLSELPTQELG